jgi:hypothetical protein
MSPDILSVGFWVAQRFQRCDNIPAMIEGFSPRGTYGTLSLVSADLALSFPRSSTPDTE